MSDENVATTVVTARAWPIVAHAQREASFLWITMERPWIEFAPNRDTLLSMKLALELAPSVPNLPDRSPT